MVSLYKFVGEFSYSLKLKGNAMSMVVADQVLKAFVLFQIKHFLCDFVLQNKYMLGKFKPAPHYIEPLAAHCTVQALGSAVAILSIFGNIDVKLLYTLLLLDFVTHFIIDRVKASPEILGRFKQDNKYFWWALGWDQMMHQLIYIIMINWVIYA